MLSTSQPIGSKRIDRLFLSFSACYGQLWRSQFKNEEFISFMKNEWAQALQQIEDKHIEEAAIQCRESKEFPPTLPQFIDMCKRAKVTRILFKRDYEEGTKTPEIALKNLAQMKAILNT
jgi:hypothetical protein